MEGDVLGSLITHKTKEKFDFFYRGVVSIGHSRAFYVVFVPPEYVLNIPYPSIFTICRCKKVHIVGIFVDIGGAVLRSDL